MQSLQIGLSNEELGWIQILNQEGLAYQICNLRQKIEPKDFGVLVVNHPLVEENRCGVAEPRPEVVTVKNLECSFEYRLRDGFGLLDQFVDALEAELLLLYLVPKDAVEVVEVVRVERIRPYSNA